MESTDKFGMESTHKFGMESTHKFSMESTHKFGITIDEGTGCCAQHFVNPASKHKKE